MKMGIDRRIVARERGLDGRSTVQAFVDPRTCGQRTLVVGRTVDCASDSWRSPLRAARDDTIGKHNPSEVRGGKASELKTEG